MATKQDEQYYEMLKFMATEPSVEYAKTTVIELRRFYRENGFLTDKQKKSIDNIWMKARV